MMIKEGQFYYNHWRNELDQHFNQSFELPLTKAPTLSERPTPAEVLDLFARLQLGLAEHFDDDDIELIITQAVDAQDPYREQ